MLGDAWLAGTVPTMPVRVGARGRHDSSEDEESKRKSKLLHCTSFSSGLPRSGARVVPVEGGPARAAERGALASSRSGRGSTMAPPTRAEQHERFVDLDRVGRRNRLA